MTGGDAGGRPSGMDGRPRAGTARRVARLFWMRARGRGVAVVCLGAALCVAGVLLALQRADGLLAAAGQQSTDDAYVRADQIALASHIAGYVAAVPVRDNQRVAAGDVVAIIRDDDYQARLTGAEADLGAARAAVAVLRGQAAQQRAAIEAAGATVRADDADVTRQRLEQRRQRALVSGGATSHRDLEEAEAAMRRLLAQRDHDLAELGVARQTLTVIERQMDQAAQTVLARQAARDLARLDVGYTRITTPVSGQLSARLVMVGDYVAAGTQVGLVVPLPDVWVVANFREAQMARMRVGQPVRVTVDGVPDHVFVGGVDSVGPVSGALQALLPPDNATGNFTKVAQRFPVKIVLAPGQAGMDRLRPGMSVIATVDTTFPGEAVSSALAVPGGQGR